mmetsp:Transcript_23112/g.34252  ORF Transcript_23112/g.34252 Transcript_23112/m.34252 type:complete len:200 (+) Transcript_23112:187-786(+)
MIPTAANTNTPRPHKLITRPPHTLPPRFGRRSTCARSCTCTSTRTSLKILSLDLHKRIRTHLAQDNHLRQPRCGIPMHQHSIPQRRKSHLDREHGTRFHKGQILLRLQLSSCQCHILRGDTCQYSISKGTFLFHFGQLIHFSYKFGHGGITSMGHFSCSRGYAFSTVLLQLARGMEEGMGDIDFTIGSIVGQGCEGGTG